MKRIAAAAAAAGFALVLSAGSAMAYTLNDDGTGFVGKGEVQLAFGWNNKQLQDNADGVSFALISTTTRENTWECYNSQSGRTAERNNTVTTDSTEVVDNVTRDRKQVTGFTLTEFGETITSEETLAEGDQPTGACPGQNTTLVAGSIEKGDPSEGSESLYAIYDGVSVELEPTVATP